MKAFLKRNKWIYTSHISTMKERKLQHKVLEKLTSVIKSPPKFPDKIISELLFIIIMCLVVVPRGHNHSTTVPGIIYTMKRWSLNQSFLCKYMMTQRVDTTRQTTRKQ